ncbi:MAG: VCBS domain-containing protein [Paludibacterium sp.]|nr:VCBS domain-containing protein [Paludibacterium sp.]
MSNMTLRLLGKKMMGSQLVHVFALPTVEDPDPDENALVTHRDWRVMLSLAGDTLGYYRVTASGIEIAFTDVPRLAKGQAAVGEIDVTSCDGTSAALKVRIGGDNTPARIEPLQLTLPERLRGKDVPFAPPAVYDDDAGENRLGEQDWTDFAHGRYRIDDTGRIVVRADKLPPLAAGQVLSAQLAVTSVDGSIGWVSLRFVGENDPGRMKPFVLRFDHHEVGHSQSVQPEVLDADPGENRLRAMAPTRVGPLSYRVDESGAVTVTLLEPAALQPGALLPYTLPVRTADGGAAYLHVNIQGPEGYRPRADSGVLRIAAREPQPVDLMPIFDQSGSMAHIDWDGRGGWQRPCLLWLKYGQQRMLAHLELTGEVRVKPMMFDHGAYTAWGDRNGSPAQLRETGWVSAAAFNEEQLQSGVMNLNVDYNAPTNLASVLQSLPDAFGAGSGRAGARKIVVLYTDGDVSGLTSAQIGEFQQQLASRGITLHVIQICAPPANTGVTLDGNPITPAMLLDKLRTEQGKSIRVADGQWLAPLLIGASQAYQAEGSLGSVGRPGGYVSQLSIAGDTWRFNGHRFIDGNMSKAHYDPGRGNLTLDTGALLVTVNMFTADYTVTQQYRSETHQQPLFFSLKGPDGAESHGTVTIALSPDMPLVAPKGWPINAGPARAAIVWTGSDDDDHFVGSPGDDTLYGHGGRDLLFGGLGEDQLYGGGGNDELYGGQGNDALYGGDGNDVLYGDWGHDTLRGGAGNDYLFGGPDNDWLDGGEGDDVLVGGMGNDRLFGGAGRDQFKWHARLPEMIEGLSDTPEIDRVMDFEQGQDQLDLSMLYRYHPEMKLMLRPLIDDNKPSTALEFSIADKAPPSLQIVLVGHTVSDMETLRAYLSDGTSERMAF